LHKYGRCVHTHEMTSAVYVVNLILTAQVNMIQTEDKQTYRTESLLIYFLYEAEFYPEYVIMYECVRVVSLARLSTKCSEWAFVTGLCPLSVVRVCVFNSNDFSSETTNLILTKRY